MASLSNIISSKNCTMETEGKVFHSEISRVDCLEENSLYDLLKIEPAIPVPQRSSGPKNDSWEHNSHHFHKLYSPKRVPPKQKVKTVADVRAIFENDVNTYITTDLELQKKFFLRKICDGLANEEKTKKVALAVLNTDKPVCKSSWQMLSNINPKNHSHPKQFVLWNSRCIQVNGSKGGKNKFICNYDLKTKQKASLKKPSNFKRVALKPRMGLLRNSLNINFKPGPLGKKNKLDVSHQKYQTGNIEIIKLPVPVLEVSPAFGSILDPTISCFVNNLRGKEGIISPKLAEFAVSVLGTVHNNAAVQRDKNVCIDFDLNYNCKQSRMIMRKNIVETKSYCNNDHHSNTNKDENISVPVKECMRTSKSVSDEVKEIMNKMLDSVVISLDGDSLYSKEDMLSQAATDNSNHSITTKEKPKKKYCELGKLDVTVINVLPENSKKDYTKPCDKSFCTMGCICESLDCLYTMKQHCGVPDCIFGCKCKSSKYKTIEFLEHECSDVIPGLFNLDNAINSHLAKEEQKFHQTVIVSGEKSILLKSRKRNWKSSKRYAEFYSKMNLKNEEKITKALTVNIERLNCENIEPLCIVHNLYKCFCRGKFTESYIANDALIRTNKVTSENVKDVKDRHDMKAAKTLDIEYKKTNTESAIKSILKPRQKKTTPSNESDFHENDTNTEDKKVSVACARTVGYHGRKYFEDFYVATNKRIKEMEQNDTLLKKKMLNLIAGTGNKDSSISEKDKESCEVLLDCEVLEDEISDTNLDTIEKRKNITDVNNYDLTNKMKNTNKTANRHLANTIEKVARVIKPDETNIVQNLDKDTIYLQAIESASKDRNYSLYEIENVTKETNYNNYINNSRTKENEKISNETNINNGDLKFPSINPDGKVSLKHWLESSYVSYKERQRKGIKDCLEPPVLGKSSFQTWNFILSRYTERRNIFFVSKKEPFRIFLAVHDKHPFFRNLINIDDIRFSDLPKYPILVRNLVTNTTDSENTFCMLRSWKEWWELIGSAVKIIEQSPDNVQDDVDFYDAENFMRKDDESEDDLKTEHLPPDASVQNTSSEKSKWFVLTLENDFTEIRFYKKGFFVTYEGIHRSINLARISGKTVRLSTKGLSEKTQSNAHPYGIYAIPSTTESCVFIGPYEEDESLGIEVIKTVSPSQTMKNTRGVWINTNKVEDKNVIDNPFAYLPPASMIHETDQLLELDANKNVGMEKKSPAKTRVIAEQSVSLVVNSAEKEKQIPKPVKPIKINRNRFYHLSPKIIKTSSTPNTMESIDAPKEPVLKRVHSLEAPMEPSTSNVLPVKPMIRKRNIVEEIKPSTSGAIVKPVAEIAPQIKITHIYSQMNIQDAVAKNKGGMHILKPEDINKKLPLATVAKDDMSTDVEKFLETSTVCIAPPESVFIISDEEDDPAAPDIVTDVWIQCSNLKNFGYIRAKSNNGSISFLFPGFNYTDYYKESEAFDKINQVLARKIYVPNNITLQWQVVQDKNMLTCDKLTLKCLEDKRYLMMKFREHRNTEAPTSQKMKIRTIEGLEETSKKLEQESVILWNEAITKRDQILKRLSVPDDLKMEMSETLQDIMAMNDQ